MDFVYKGTKIVGNKLFSTPIVLSMNSNERFYCELKNVLKIRRVENNSFIRIGRMGDGGYIMVDEFDIGRGGVAYSFGISNEISWDADMAKRGYDVFMYDMTIEKLPYENEKFHFFKEGIGGVKDEAKSLDTLDNFIARNGHQNNSNMILKMDVEGAEWNFLETVSAGTMRKFEQIVFEFHDLTSPKTFAAMERIINLIDKINVTHTLVHLHGNNNKHFINIENIGIVPDVLELSYLRTEHHKFHDDREIFLPSRLDIPNDQSMPDIPLGYWNKFRRFF